MNRQLLSYFVLCILLIGIGLMIHFNIFDTGTVAEHLLSKFAPH